MAQGAAAEPALAKTRWKGGDDQAVLRAESPQPDLTRLMKSTAGGQDKAQYMIESPQSQSLLTSTAPLAQTALEDTAHSVALDKLLPGGEVLGTGAASATNGALPATGSASGSALAGQVANQITNALPRQDGLLITPTTTEIALDPPELGKLRIVVSEGATGINIAITAERGETADLMRRHIDLLRQEFAREGVTGGSIEFNQGDPSQRGDQNSSDPERSANGPAVEPIEDANALDANALPNPGRTASGGLDLRL
ncbi:MAG: flagellar hook-length control protein FliK [Pseudomonadota bacterium]